MLPYNTICKFDTPIPDHSSSLIIPYSKQDKEFIIHHDFTPELSKSLTTFLKLSNASNDSGTVRVYATNETDNLNYPFIALVSCKGDTKSVGSVEFALLGSAAGLKALKSMGVRNIVYSTSYMPEQMALGGYLANYNYDLLNVKKKDIVAIRSIEPNDLFRLGQAKGYHQNFARFLSDTPANLMTPSLFVDYANDFLHNKNLTLKVHDMDYILKNNMNLYASVTEGSDQPPKFLIISYQGRQSQGTDISLIGKGITFDSGGISLKGGKGMSDMKADMMGAATVLSAISLICESGTEVNLTVTIPLCENLPSGKASKPGDVRVSMKGISVEIDNTDAEGRLILGDAMTHAQRESPRYMIDVATLTGAINVALGNVYMGLYCNDDAFAELIKECGECVYNEVWRMPLNAKYKTSMKSDVADIRNIGEGGGGSCTAAIFLNEFVEGNVKWAHLDIAGVMNKCYEKGLYGSTMSGKPVCLLYEVIVRLSRMSD